MKKFLFIFLTCVTVVAVAQKKNPATTYANTITAEDMKQRLYIVASKEMEGRETARPGQKRAAAYIEDQFKSFGLEPGNHGQFQLHYDVFEDSLINTEVEVNGKPYELDKDFSVNVGQSNNATYRFSEVVFVGNGNSDSTHDDYKGLDVRGKVVLMLGGQPQGGRGSGGRFGGFFAKADAAQKNGAVAIMVIGTNFPRLTKTNPKGNMYVNAYHPMIRPNQFTVSEEIARAIMGPDYDAAKSGNIQSKTYDANLLLNFNKVTLHLVSSDVLGVVEGTDLKDQYVFVTGHYDHLGKRDTVIYYGADDDGSGTVSVLEIAQAFANAKKEGKGPRRTMVFMTVSGEEKGLWGSAYYTDHPVFPLNKTTVDLNIDMIGRIDTSRKNGNPNNYVYVVGDDKLSTDLRTISESVNKKFTKLELDYKFNDPKDPNRIYFRSDHYNFARKGVPIIFYFDGMLAPDYHRPTDTPDKINYDLLTKRAQLVFYTAWDMANRDDMLKRDLKLDIPSR
ncbi:MAG: M28 family peptidase [Bacteroidetes bacterium]|nr:M28 family peptidase [Bacteroidota bacterium]MBS1931964.1 M28 family peptidase [Bacteroidota bacterium]